MKYSSTVLIVDDEPAGREAIEGLLLSQGYNLVFATNGVEALAKAAELAPDVILLDVMMPGMNGFDVCRRLRADPRLAEAPVIMVTALDDHDSRMQGLEAGADDFVSKPFDRAELRVRVRTVTQLNRYRRLISERVKFEWVVEQTDDGYLLISEDGAIVYANPRARLYLGLPISMDESIPPSKIFLEIIQKQYRCQPSEAWTSWPEQPPPALRSPRFLVRPESPTAHAIWLQVDVLDIPAGSNAGWLVRLRDVTRQMALRREMWEFHSMVGHKLRTPMTGLSVSLEVMAKEMASLSADELAQFAQMAFRNAGYLHSQIEDILRYLDAPTLARPGAGVALHRLEAIVTEICNRLGLQDVTLSGQENLSEARLSLTRPAVELVMWEILENAQKFHPQLAPTVEIAVSRLEDKMVHIQVRDNGMTLSPEQLARVWIPYYQGEKDFTGQVIGMGLGLSMVASLIWEVGGTCRMYNRPEGPGIVVELVLPLIEEGRESSH